MQDEHNVTCHTAKVGIGDGTGTGDRLAGPVLKAPQQCLQLGEVVKVVHRREIPGAWVGPGVDFACHVPAMQLLG